MKRMVDRLAHEMDNQQTDGWEQRAFDVAKECIIQGHDLTQLITVDGDEFQALLSILMLYDVYPPAGELIDLILERSPMFTSIMMCHSLHAFRALTERGMSVSSLDVNGWNALHIASMCADLEIMREIMNFHNVDVTIRSNRGMSAWDYFKGNVNKRKQTIGKRDVSDLVEWLSK